MGLQEQKNLTEKLCESFRADRDNTKREGNERNHRHGEGGLFPTQ